MSQSLELQMAVVAALENAAGLAGWPVFDGPPAGAPLPYITIGPDLVADISGQEAPLKRHRFAVTLWAGAAAVSALKPAMAAAEAAVLAMETALPSARVVWLDFRRGFTRRDVRSGLVRGEVEFEAGVAPL